MKFQRPVLVNFTRPAAGADVAFVDVAEFSRRMGQNTGNMAFLYALLLSIEELKHVTDRPLATADVKIWGCSNFISAKRQMMVDDSPLYTDGKPMIAIGLGAQATNMADALEVPQATQEWISAISDMAPSDSPNITLRGAYTYKVLARIGLHTKCIVLGCPSLYISPHPDLGARLREKLTTPVRFLGVAPGNIENVPPKFLNLERHLATLVTFHSGSYLCQHPPVLFRMMFEPFRKLDLLEANAVRAAIQPDMALEDFLHWFRLHARVFDNIPSWLTHLRSLDVMLSARIHGAQLALQAGTPALCIALDVRQVELCQTMRIPFVEWAQLGSDFSVEDVRAHLAAFDWDAFDVNRRDLARKFARFLAGNGLKPSKHLRSIYE